MVCNNQTDVNWRMGKVLFALLRMLISTHAFAQINVSQEVLPGFTEYISYSTKDGLPSSEVHCLHQDRQGYLWLGTDQGLVRFDSEEMDVYTSFNGMPDNMVVRIEEDEGGNIWLESLNKKLFYIDSSRKKVVVPDFNLVVDSSFLIYKIGDWAMDEFGNGVIGIYKKGIYKAFKKDPTSVRPNHLFVIRNYQVVETLSADPTDFQCFTWSVDGNDFWFYNNTGKPSESGSVSSSQVDGFHFFSTSYDLPSWHTKPMTKRPLFLSLADGRQLIAVSSRLIELDADKTTVLSNRELPSDIIELYQDSGNNLWVGLNAQMGGVFFQNSDLRQNGVPCLDGFTPTSFLEDDKGAFWVGTREAGVLRFSNSIFRPIPLPKPFKTINVIKEEQGRIFTVMDGTSGFELQQHNGTWQWLKMLDQRNQMSDFWCISDSCFVAEIGTEGGYMINLLISKEEPICLSAKNAPNKYIRMADEKLLGYSNITYYLIDLKEERVVFRGLDKRRTIRVNNAMRFSKGGAILATPNGLLRVIDGDPIPIYQDLLNGIFIYDLVETSGGDLWVATKGNGLFKIDIESGDFKLYSMEDGLPQNSIYDLQLTDSFVFGGTNAGLFSLPIEPDSLNGIRRWNRSSGMPFSEVQSLASANGHLLIKGWNELLSVELSQLAAIRNDFKVSLKGVQVNGKPLNRKNLLDLKASQNNLEIHFGGFHFGEKNQKYWYQLTENGRWKISDDNQLDLLNLQSGDYQLTVSTAREYLPGKSLVLPFTINEPFVGSISFFLLIFIPGTLLLAFIFRILWVRERLKNRLLVSQQKALTSQMNPHFIFNALSSIQFFIGQGSKELAQSYLSSFAQLMRQVLDASTLGHISLGKELEGLKSYMELEELRFDSRISCHVSLADDVRTRLTDIRLPTMIIQPYIENAILHGLHPNKGKGNLNLDFSIHQDSLRILVTDDGIGREASRALKQKRNHRSHGMSITSKRIALLNKRMSRKILITVSDAAPSGTKVELKIPITKKGE